MRAKTSLTVCAAIAAVGPALAQFDIARSTVDGGGTTVAGGTYTLSGTIGQPDASKAAGGPVAVFGGFWSDTAACAAGDVTTTGTSNGLPDGVVDLSDFSVFLTLWSSSSPRADLTTSGSSNGIPDGQVDLSDFSVYLTLWSAGCG